MYKNIIQSITKEYKQLRSASAPPPSGRQAFVKTLLSLLAFFFLSAFRTGAPVSETDQLLIKNSFVIKLKAGINCENQFISDGIIQTGNRNLDLLMKAAQVKQLRKIFYSPAETDEGRFYEVRLKRELENIKDIANMFRQLPEVEFVETMRWMRSTLTPNDCLFNSNSGCYSSTWAIEQWGLKNDGKVVTAYTGPDIPESRFDADVDADLAWDITTGDDTVIVAFVDTGMDWGHPEFTNNLWVNPLEDANADGAFQQSDLGDINGDGYPGTRNVDDDNDGGTDFNDPDIRNKDYDCDGTRLWGPDQTVGTGDDDPEDIVIAANDDDENGLPDDIIGWDYTDGQWCGSGNYPGDWDVSTTDPSGTASPHGNSVSSIAVAEGNNNGSAELDKAMAGVAWDSRIMTLRTSYDGLFNPAVVATAIDYAKVHYANIINLSLGDTSDVTILKTAVQNAINAGCFVVASAGNDDQSSNRTYPASYPNVCGVMGSDRRDLKASFSNFNNSSSSDWYDLLAPGDSITSLLPLDQVNNPNYMDDYYYIASGTSASAPFVSGTAVLMKSAYPRWTNLDMLYQLNNMADNVDTLQSASHVGKLGHGRLNTARSLGYGGLWKSVFWKFHKSWEKRAFVADTMVVDSSVILTLKDSLVIYNAVGYPASADGVGGLKLVEGAQLIVPDSATVIFPSRFYVEIGRNCTFKIGKHARVTFGDTCFIHGYALGTFLIDSTATFTIGRKSAVVMLDSATMKVMPKALVSSGDSTIILVAGQLLAQTTSGNEMRFTRRNSTETWTGIKIIPSTGQPYATRSILDNAIVEYALNGVEAITDSVQLVNNLFRYNYTGIKTGGASPIIDSNRIVSNTYAGMHLGGQQRTVTNNKVVSNSAYGIIISGTSNLWIKNKADSNATGLQAYLSATSNFRSNSVADSLTGNTFRYNSTRGITSSGASPSFLGASGQHAHNSCHSTNRNFDIESLNSSTVLGLGNYVLNGVTTYQDMTSTLIWDWQKMWDPIPNSSPLPQIANVRDTIISAVQERLRGNYTNSMNLLKTMINRNHAGQYSPHALRLAFSILNDAEFVLRNNDQISREITTARNTFDSYVQSLRSNSPSANLKKAAAILFADHQFVRRKYSSADSLYGYIGSQHPNSGIEMHCLYGQAITRKILGNRANALTSANDLRSKYPDDPIGVVAKIYLDEPLTEAEKRLIGIDAQSPPILSIGSQTIDGFALHQNYPNPFSARGGPATEIAFEIPKACRVHVSIVDALGREAHVLTNNEYEAGYHSLRFDASQYPSGLYFYKMVAGNFVAVKKMAVMK